MASSAVDLRSCPGIVAQRAPPWICAAPIHAVDLRSRGHDSSLASCIPPHRTRRARQNVAACCTLNCAVPIALSSPR
nr:hypothetical protein [Zea mays]